MKADHLTADCPDCGRSFNVKPPRGHRFLTHEEIAEDSRLTRAAEARATRIWRRMLRERRIRARQVEPDIDVATRAFLEAYRNSER